MKKHKYFHAITFKMSKEVGFRINYSKNGAGATGYFPKKLLDDSAFPFGNNDQLIIRIEEGKLIIEKRPFSDRVEGNP
jgi:hypothetical protein